MKKFLIILLVIVSIIIFTKSTGPGYNVIINAPMIEVWTYASDSTKAVEWSVFFDHISPLPGIDDGKVGSLRRCYRFSDNTGPTWDEEVLEVKNHEFRHIRTFNIQNFKTLHKANVEFDVYQYYEKISDTQTKLTFSSRLRNLSGLRYIIELLDMNGETQRIFKTNLENIKEAIESRYEDREYLRPHKFENFNDKSDIKV